jgi:hypothetical protein
MNEALKGLWGLVEKWPTPKPYRTDKGKSLARCQGYADGRNQCAAELKAELEKLAAGRVSEEQVQAARRLSDVLRNPQDFPAIKRNYPSVEEDMRIVVDALLAATAASQEAAPSQSPATPGKELDDSQWKEACRRAFRNGQVAMRVLIVEAIEGMEHTHNSDVLQDHQWEYCWRCKVERVLVPIVQTDPQLTFSLEQLNLLINTVRPNLHISSSLEETAKQIMWCGFVETAVKILAAYDAKVQAEAEARGPITFMREVTGNPDIDGPTEGQMWVECDEGVCGAVAWIPRN